MTAVLRWSQSPGTARLRWIGPNNKTLAAQAERGTGSIVAVVGSPGGGGSLTGGSGIKINQNTVALDIEALFDAQ